MAYDNEANVWKPDHTAEGNVLDIPGWIGSFTEDGVFNDMVSANANKCLRSGPLPKTLSLQHVTFETDRSGRTDDER